MNQPIKRSCPFCAEAIRGDEPTCPHCGNHLRVPTPTAGGMPVPLRGRSRGIAIAIGLTAGLLIVGAVAFGAWWALRRDSIPPELPAPVVISAKPAEASEPVAALEGDDVLRAVPIAVIDLHVMSKCPYAALAEDVLADTLTMLGGGVALNIHFIGRETDNGLESMHGESEVRGDLLQVCAGKQQPRRQLAFARCMNRNRETIPDGWEICADQAGLDVMAISACATNGEGARLLGESFATSERANAKGSPTIRIDGEEYTSNRKAIDVARQVCASHASQLPACATLPPPAEVRAFAVTDPRCGQECDPTTVFDSLRAVLPGLKTTTYIWGADPQAEALAREIGVHMLPLIVFDETLDRDPEGAEQLAKWLEPLGRYRRLKVKSEFDPVGEICDNGIDDTSDGLVDCDDPGCFQKLACRPERSRTLEVFIMSQCPYARQAVSSMRDVLEAFGSDLDFTIHYIATESDGEIQSMHGPREVEEDVRALCAAKMYGANGRYLEYLWCRAGAATEDDWRGCAQGMVDAEAIEQCVDSGTGIGLLRADIEIAERLEIAASPTWVVNGSKTFNALTPAAIQSGFCRENPGLTGCGTPLRSE